jgi:DNA polymerase-3 subunit gamma/tau
MIRGLAAREAAAMLRVLDQLVDEGHDLLHFWSELVGAIRDLLLLRSTGGKDELLSRPTEESRLLSEASGDLSVEDLLRTFQILADLEPGLRASGKPRYLFEATLIRLAGLGAVRPIEEVLASLGGATTPAPPVEKKTPVPRVGVDGSGRAAAERTPAPAGAATSPPQGDLGGRLVARLIEVKPLLGTILEQARSLTLLDDGLHVAFDPGMESVARQLSRKEYLACVEQEATRLAGRKLRIHLDVDTVRTEIRPTGKTGPPADLPRKTQSTDRPAARRGSAGGQLIEQATREPGVKKLLHEFGAQVVEIRPTADPGETGPTEES